jgi:hypothetical protein
MAFPTLSDLDGSGEQLTGHCRRCAHASFLDVEFLRRRFGPAFRLLAIGPKLRCTRCGWFGGSITRGAWSTGPSRRDKRIIIDPTPPYTELRSL